MVRYRYAWIALTLFYLLLRFQNTPGVLTDHGVVFNDTDPYYRMHRIESMVRGSLSYPLDDRSLDYPSGMQVPWPIGLDLLLTLPLKLTGVRAESTIESFSAIAIPWLSLPTLWATGYIAAELGGPLCGLVAGFLLALFRGHLNASDIGAVDHHFLEGMFTILGLALLLFLRKRSSQLPLFLLCGLLGLGPVFWPQGWIVGFFVAGALLLSRDRAWFSTGVTLFLASSLVSLAPLALSARFGTGYLSPFGFSWWTPFSYAVLAFFFAQISVLFGSERAVARRDVARTLWLLVPIALFLLFRNGVHGISSPVAGGWNAVEAAKGTISVTSEAASPGGVSFIRFFRSGYYAIVIAWIWFASMAFSRERWWIVGYAFGPFLLSMFQLRFFPLASPLLALSVALLLGGIASRWIAHPAWRTSAISVTALLLCLPELPPPVWLNLENAHPFFIPVRGASRFLSRERDRLRLPPGTTAVASHWDFGHWILHDTNLSVVANPFQPASSVETARLYLSRDVNDLERFYSHHPVRYLVIEGATGRILRWFKMTGIDPAPYFKSLPLTELNGPALEILPPFYDLLISRYFFANGEDARGKHPPHWRLIFVSPFSSPDDERMPALKLFERVPGARIVAGTGERELFLTAEIAFPGGKFKFRRSGKRDAAGRTSWTAPYAKVNQGGVVFDGRYAIETGRGKRIAMTPVIPEEAVFAGTTFDLGRVLVRNPAL
ncbi:MAG: STT3 domain-containing protein [Pseudomonadota bacterium]